MENYFNDYLFCDFEISKLLYDLGFNEPCMGRYQYDTKRPDIKPEFLYHKINVDNAYLNPLGINSLYNEHNMFVHVSIISAPLWQQAVKFINAIGDTLPKEVYVCADFMDMSLLKTHIKNAIDSIKQQK